MVMRISRKMWHAAASIAALALASTLAGQSGPIDLAALEKRAEADFTRRDCAAAETSYLAAVDAALGAGEPGRTGLYYRRIGICRSRLGKIPEALDAYRHGIAVTEQSGDIDLQAENVHGAALALQKLGRIDEAVPLAEREYALTQKSGHPEQIVRAMWMLSDLYGALGRTRTSLQLLERALAISRTTSDHDGTMILLDNLALYYSDLGDFDAALHAQGEIMAALDSKTPPAGAAIEYNNLGEIQLRSGHPDLAWKSYEKAVELSKGPEGWRIHLGALLNVAEMRNRAGQTESSDAAFREALEIARKTPIPDLESIGLRMRSDALLIRGDVAGAEAAAEEALRIARQIASPDRLYQALLALGSARSAAGKPGQAGDCFDEGLRIAEALRAQTAGEASDLRGAFAKLVPLYQASARNLIELHREGDALQRAEQGKARVLMDILLRGGVDERAVMTTAEAEQQQTLRKRMAAANETATKDPSPAAMVALQDSMREFRQFRRTLYDNHPDLSVQSADFEPAGPDRIGELLPGPKTALLDYFMVPSGVALFVVRQAEDPGGKPRISAFILPDSKHTLAAEARAFREQLARRELGYKAAAQHLFGRLLGPAMGALRGTTDWVVSPDGALWEVPFEALIDSAGRHVIETRSVTLTPSLTAALEIRKGKQGAGTADGLRLLALGNPSPALAPLPDAAREVTAIGANYAPGSALVLTGNFATAAAFREMAPSARIIHLAAHAGLNNNDPLSSYVQLGDGEKGSAGDGVLTALDIMSLHLHADLVVLSACETALGSTGPGEGMMGMGWALSAAGAKSSILSFWKVDSAASRVFMTSFHKGLAAGGEAAPGAVALRRAGLAMLQSQEYRHPFYWAGFALWGDGGAVGQAAVATARR